MVYLNFVTDLNIYLYLYMFIYNLSVIGLFWVFFSFVNSDIKTLYSFSLFSFDSFHLFFITILIFSLAGVPPFVGFFSKLFLLNILINKNLYYLYFLLFVIILVGLYFYVQNVRFLHSSNSKNTSKIYWQGSEKVQIIFAYFALVSAFTITNGVIYLDDLLLVFTWLFS